MQPTLSAELLFAFSIFADKAETNLRHTIFCCRKKNHIHEPKEKRMLASRKLICIRSIANQGQNWKNDKSSSKRDGTVWNANDNLMATYPRDNLITYWIYATSFFVEKIKLYFKLNMP